MGDSLSTPFTSDPYWNVPVKGVTAPVDIVTVPVNTPPAVADVASCGETKSRL